MIIPQTTPVGQPLTFEGYADDYDKAITALEFTLDGGTTWATHDVSDTTADLWVHWSFSYTPQVAGEYQLKVRSVSEDGRRSPLSAVANFTALP